jgi:hypothetical protein
MEKYINLSKYNELLLSIRYNRFFMKIGWMGYGEWYLLHLSLARYYPQIKSFNLLEIHILRFIIYIHFDIGKQNE